MTRRSIILRNLRHFKWSNVAVCAGVIVATAVLTGALMVGDSVRGSLRDLTIQRMGPIDDALIAPRFFGESLASRIAQQPEFSKSFGAIHNGIITRGGAGKVDDAVRTAGVQIAAIEGDWVPVASGGCVINGELAGTLEGV
jgi:putative ABC transport system permease protein